MQSTFRLDRRAFVTGTAALAASSALLALNLGTDVRPALFVCDRHCAPQLPAADRPGDILWFNGDVTSVWWNTLRPLWRTGEARVAGVTRAPTLFCLEQLAHGARHRVIARQPLGSSDAIRWIIAPVRSGGLV